MALGRVGQELQVVAPARPRCVPAASMIASAPHVSAPAAGPRHDRERAAAGLGLRTAGRRSPRHDVEHAAGAEGDLGLAGPHAGLPDQRALLVADERGDRRPAGQRGGLADRARSCRRASAASPRGSAARRARGVAQPDASARSSPVTPALLRSVTWRPPPRQRPRHPGVDGAEAQVARGARGRRCRAATPPWWPTGSARAGCPWRPARGRCRWCGGPASRGPGPTGSPVARSHTMVDARWLVMPTASTGPPAARASLGDVEHRGGHRRGVELDEAGERGVGREGAVGDVLDGGVRAHDGGPQAARADVDDEDAHWCSLRCASAARAGRRSAPPIAPATKASTALGHDAAPRDVVAGDAPGG